jgi:poly-beta-1,6-N-acetyl-D-glucosamine biosynthesis protein PgaD
MFLQEPQFEEGIIIDHPGMISTVRRIAEWSISVASWALWVFILRPLLVLVLWSMGIEFFYSHMLEQGGIRNPRLFAAGLVVIALILVTVSGWNLYDRIRYGGKYKGRSRGIAENDFMGAFFNISNEDVRQIKQQKYIDVSFEDEHAIEFSFRGREEVVRGHYDPQRLEQHFDRIQQRRSRSMEREELAPTPARQDADQLC